MNPNHHVVRIDIEPTEEQPKRSATHGWQVRVSFQGKRRTKFFADRKYGGRDKALALAIEHRDRLLAERPGPEDGPVERRAQSRSTSGVAGVRLAFKNGSAYVEANWIAGGKRSVSSFSVERWGLRKAAWQACKARAVGRGVRDPQRVHEMFERAFPNLERNLEKARRGAAQDVHSNGDGHSSGDGAGRLNGHRAAVVTPKHPEASV